MGVMGLAQMCLRGVIGLAWECLGSAEKGKWDECKALVLGYRRWPRRRLSPQPLRRGTGPAAAMRLRGKAILVAPKLAY